MCVQPPGVASARRHYFQPPAGLAWNKLYVPSTAVGLGVGRRVVGPPRADIIAGNRLAVPAVLFWRVDRPLRAGPDARVIAALSPGLLVLPAFLFIAWLLIWGLRVHARRVRDEVRAFAQRSNLTVEEETILGFTSVKSLQGEQHGRAVRYWSYTKGSGKSRTHWIAVAVAPRADGGLTFELTRQGLGAKIMEFFGTKEIQVGDRAFDDAWFVRTNQPDFLAAALVPEIRGRFMAEAPKRLGSGYRLEAGLVQYTEQGSLAGESLARLESQLPLLHGLADVAEVAAGRAGR